jgi:hypothetical protein
MHRSANTLRGAANEAKIFRARKKERQKEDELAWCVKAPPEKENGAGASLFEDETPATSARIFALQSAIPREGGMS